MPKLLLQCHCVVPQRLSREEQANTINWLIAIGVVMDSRFCNLSARVLHGSSQQQACFPLPIAVFARVFCLSQVESCRDLAIRIIQNLTISELVALSRKFGRHEFIGNHGDVRFTEKSFHCFYLPSRQDLYNICNDTYTKMYANSDRFVDIAASFGCGAFLRKLSDNFLTQPSEQFLNLINSN